MKNAVKFSIFIPTVFLAVFLFSYSISEARSGCCSSHGGVCGCGCCDGTGLSATCAPYYPSCNSSQTYTPPVKTYVAPVPATPKTTTAPTQTAPASTSPSAKTNAQPVIVTDSSKKSNTSDDNLLGTGIAIGAIGVGGLAWYLNKKKNNIQK